MHDKFHIAMVGAVGFVLFVTPRTQAEKYPISSFDNLQGVIAYDVWEDSRGFIWVAADAGVWRWERNGFESLNDPNIRGTRANCLMEDDHGRIWVGTRDGAFGIDIETRRPDPQARLLQGLTVSAFFRDQTGRHWAGTDDGLYRLRLNKEVVRAELVEGTEGCNVHHVAVDPNGDLWLGVPGALLYVSNTGVETRFEGQFSRGPLVLLQESDGPLWVGMRDPGALYRIENGRADRITTEQGLLNDDVNALVESPSGEVWVGTEKGVFRWTDGRFLALDHQRGLENTDIHALRFDREGQLWIGTFGGGVYQLRSPHILIFDMDEGLRHPAIADLSRHPDGRIILATHRGAYAFDEGNNAITPTGGQGHLRVTYVDSRGETWFGEKTALRRGPTGPRLDVPHYLCALGEDADGKLLVGTIRGLLTLTDNALIPVVLPAGATGTVFAIHRGRDGSTFLGTQDGLIHIKVGEAAKFLSDLPVFAICAKRDDGLWLGTASGLAAFEQGEVRPITLPTMRIGRVWNLNTDPNGTLWAATSDGLFRYDGKRLECFTRADGLPSTDVRAVCPVAGGDLLVGTTGGLARIDLAQLAPCETPPRLIIECWSAGQALGHSAGESVTIRSSLRDVLLQVHCLGWRSAVGVQYQYKLEGLDQSWSEPTGTTVRQYIDLAPGRYTFMAKAVNARGVESDTVAKFMFAVPAAFWQEPWVMRLVAVFVLGSAAPALWLNARRRRHLAERRRAEAAVAASERKYRSLFNTSRDGINFTDLHGRIEDANPAFLDMLGYSLEELKSMTYQELTPAKWAAMETDIIEHQVMTRGYSDEYEKEYIRADGTIFPIVLRVWLVKDETGRPLRMLGLFRDITERKRAEALAQQRHAELAHLSRLSTMGEMATGLAHELNQPLAAIANYANGTLRRLEHAPAGPVDVRHALEQVAAQAARTGDIIRRTREFVRRREPHRAPAKINALIRDSLGLAEHEIRDSGLTVRLELAEEIPDINVDRVEIQQVLLNLIRNAIEAMTDAVTSTPTLVITTASSGDEFVEVRVRDNGPGVSPEDIDQIFHAFFTTKREGMGMGLPISRSIIEQHGGQLLLSLNHPERGVTLRFTLPADNGAQHPNYGTNSHECQTHSVYRG